MSSSASFASSGEGRLTVPVSQFAKGDFPPVCAMTGERAETWRKFIFGSLPPWAYALIVVPYVGHVALGMLERTARGRLPLTRSSARQIDAAGGHGVLLLGVAFALWAGIAVIGIAVGPHPFNALESTAAGLLVVGGLVSLAAGAGALLSGRRSIGPQGVVRRTLSPRALRVVEIWNVHPSFVAATIARIERIDPQTDDPQ